MVLQICKQHRPHRLVHSWSPDSHSIRPGSQSQILLSWCQKLTAWCGHISETKNILNTLLQDFQYSKSSNKLITVSMLNNNCDFNLRYWYWHAVIIIITIIIIRVSMLSKGWTVLPNIWVFVERIFYGWMSFLTPTLPTLEPMRV